MTPFDPIHEKRRLLHKAIETRMREAQQQFEEARAYCRFLADLIAALEADEAQYRRPTP